MVGLSALSADRAVSVGGEHVGVDVCHVEDATGERKHRRGRHRGDAVDRRPGAPYRPGSQGEGIVQRAGPAARPKHFRVAAACLAAALVALGLAACNPVKGPPPEPPVISTTPALFPAFQSDVLDYVNRCDPNTPTDGQVDAPAGTTVSVNGSPPSNGQFSVAVPQSIDEQFTIDVATAGNTTTHHVRCLPTDFPTFTVQQNGPTQAQFYAASLVQGFGSPNYPV